MFFLPTFPVAQDGWRIIQFEKLMRRYVFAAPIIDRLKIVEALKKPTAVRAK